MSITDNIVVSSRIRLARNIDGTVFPSKLNDERASLIARKVYEALSPAEENGYDLYKMSKISKMDGGVLMEKHLISTDLLQNSQFGAAIIHEDETVSVMINEEDHVREQVIMKGFKLKEAYKKASKIDDTIAVKLKFAFDPKLGYLTSCPTNIGTGLRASAMMFLPGLSLTGNLEQCIAAVARLNMTVRGVYGEGSGSQGYLYQISNQKTLGVTEEEIISAVEESINHIAESEIKARDILYRTGEAEMKDKILRSWGVLTNCYKVSASEFMQLLAYVKLGVYYGIIKVKDYDRLEKLNVDAQPANIANICGRTFSGDVERDVYRAGYCGKTLRSLGEIV